MYTLNILVNGQWENYETYNLCEAFDFAIEWIKQYGPEYQMTLTDAGDYWPNKALQELLHGYYETFLKQV